MVLAPLTRMRADLRGNVPSDLMAKYYAQRASKGGLMIPQATFISPSGIPKRRSLFDRRRPRRSNVIDFRRGAGSRCLGGHRRPVDVHGR
jgi:2,4-dienoyl-CoA reductase-like NADH-dependent reductase (Old Yellow Enzyme family)